MHTIAVANQKGGIGKTTVAVSLAAALARANKTILLVDDEDADRQVMARRLTLAGYTILEAANGREALDRLRRAAE